MPPHLIVDWASHYFVDTQIYLMGLTQLRERGKRDKQIETTTQERELQTNRHPEEKTDRKTHWKTDRQTERHIWKTDRQTYWERNTKVIELQTYWRTDGQTDKRTNGRMNGWTDGHTDSSTEDRDQQPDRQTDKQIDRPWMDVQTHRQNDRRKRAADR